MKSSTRASFLPSSFVTRSMRCGLQRRASVWQLNVLQHYSPAQMLTALARRATSSKHLLHQSHWSAIRSCPTPLQIRPFQPLFTLKSFSSHAKMSASSRATSVLHFPRRKRSTETEKSEFHLTQYTEKVLHLQGTWFVGSQPILFAGEPFFVFIRFGSLTFPLLLWRYFIECRGIIFDHLDRTC